MKLMTRIPSLASVAVVLALAAVGCSGGSDGPRNDVPIKTGPEVDKKGKASRTMEATLEDPKAKKR
jgi:hypothetical protein